MIYLDNAATTRVDPEVLQAMMSYMEEAYGNAGALYKFGRDAASAVNEARWSVAKFFHAAPENIVFTSGASEGNSATFKNCGYILNTASGKNRLVTTEIEHDSVLGAVLAMQRGGFEVGCVKPDNDGLVTAESVISQVDDKTGVVSVMFENNEVGTINEIAKIGEFCRRSGIIFHVDCTQAAGQIDLDAAEYYFDFATISGHKFHGPKGVGALYVRDRTTMLPLIYGGQEQEYGLRGGTENVPAIVGLGKACELAQANLKASGLHIAQIKQVFVTSLLKHLGVSKLSDAGIFCNGVPWFKEGKILNLRIDGVSGEAAVITMDALGVCISAGSACTSRESKPSHVLTAMGLSDDEARSSIRISFSKFTTELEAEQAGELLAQCIMMLRKEGADKWAIR